MTDTSTCTTSHTYEADCPDCGRTRYDDDALAAAFASSVVAGEAFPPCTLCGLPSATPRLSRRATRTGDSVIVGKRRGARTNAEAFEVGTVTGWGPSRLRIRTSDGRTVDYPSVSHCVHQPR